MVRQANKIERKILMERVKRETFRRKIFSFYRYVRIENPETFRDQLYQTWFPMNVLGRIFVATEGINAQMSVPESIWSDFLTTLNLFPQLQDIRMNDAVESGKYAFFKLDIRARDRILADGLDEHIFETSSIGTHLSPQEFHEMVGEKDVIVVDARNGYECDIGHFEGAVLPKNRTFAKVLPEIKNTLQNHKDKKILMYCTGGIRCEKASAYMKKEGFKHVFQLKGGIIHYANEIKKLNLKTKFIGSNFVFDERMAESITDHKLVSCQHCGNAHSSYSNCENVHCHGMMIQCPSCAQKYEHCCSSECMEKKSMQKKRA